MLPGMSDNPAISESEVRSPERFFGPSPLLPGEDAKSYAALQDSILRAIKPTDIVEQIWVHDVVDYTWQIWRWRKLKNRLTLDEIPNQLEKVLGPLVNEYILAPGYRGLETFIYQTDSGKCITAGYKLAQKWAIGDSEATKKIEGLLETQNLSMEAITARAIATILDRVDRIDRAILNAEGWRNSILREIDRRKATFAQKLRSAVDKIEDAEFETIEKESEGSVARK